MTDNARKDIRKNNRIWSVVKLVVCNNLALSVGMVVAIIGAVSVGLIPPLVLERMINELTSSRQITVVLIVLYVGLLAVSGIFDALKESIITVFGQKVTHGLRSAMCKKMSRLPASYFIENETGIITSRFVNDVDTVEALFDSGVISMIADGCKVLSILVVIFIISKGLGVLMIIVTPILMVLTLFVQKRMLTAQVDNRVAVGKANNHVPETINNIRMIHTFQVEKYMQKRYRRYINDGYQAMEKSNFYDAVYSPVIITISEVIVAVMMICSAMGGEIQTFFGMSVGTAVAVISYVSKVFDPLESIGMEIQNIQSAVAGIYRINEFLCEEERCIVKGTDMSEGAGQAGSTSSNVAIEFNNVDFGYTSNQQILDNFSFSVHNGENVTLTGRTGAGKSTAFKLILGMYDAWNGDVRVYGTPVGEISDAARAHIIGYVEQTFHMIPGSVRDQMTLKDNGISDEQVWQALSLVELDETVKNFENGLDTPCHPSLFSQGQIQLLSIARAIVNNPPILLLDEITANLDSVTEANVLEALRKVSHNRTVLSISHRVYETIGQAVNGRCITIE